MKHVSAFSLRLAMLREGRNSAEVWSTQVYRCLAGILCTMHRDKKRAGTCAFFPCDLHPLYDFVLCLVVSDMSVLHCIGDANAFDEVSVDADGTAQCRVTSKMCTRRGGM